MLTMEYILKAQRLVEQYQREELPLYHDYSKPQEDYKETEAINFRRGLKIDPETGERYFDFLD